MPKILAVEDDRDLQYLYELMLSKNGFEVEVAANVVQGLLRLTNDVYDLIILDLNMPDLPGTKIIEFIRDDARLKHIPVIVISANDTGRKFAMALGARAFLVKPVKMQELLAIVHDQLPV